LSESGIERLYRRFGVDLTNRIDCSRLGRIHRLSPSCSTLRQSDCMKLCHRRFHSLNNSSYPSHLIALSSVSDQKILSYRELRAAIDKLRRALRAPAARNIHALSGHRRLNCSGKISVKAPRCY
jgi:hypothetical protein